MNADTPLSLLRRSSGPSLEGLRRTRNNERVWRLLGHPPFASLRVTEEVDSIQLHCHCEPFGRRAWQSRGYAFLEIALSSFWESFLRRTRNKMHGGKAKLYFNPLILAI